MFDLPVGELLACRRCRNPAISVSENHCFVIPKRHINDYFELTNEELVACNDIIKVMKNKIT